MRALDDTIKGEQWKTVMLEILNSIVRYGLYSSKASKLGDEHMPSG